MSFGLTTHRGLVVRRVGWRNWVVFDSFLPTRGQEPRVLHSATSLRKALAWARQGRP